MEVSMFSLTNLDNVKIQKCPGSCKLVFLTFGPLTLRIKKDVFVKLSEKMSEFVSESLPKKHKAATPERELALVKGH